MRGLSTSVSEYSKDEYIVLATKQGWIKRTSLYAFEKSCSRGLAIASLDKNDKLQWCYRCTDHDDILLGSSNGMAVRFPACTLRPTGRTSRGVISLKLRDKVLDYWYFDFSIFFRQTAARIFKEFRHSIWPYNASTVIA
jgi:DNA gyrase/topoisomerase IV subunit A